MTTGEIFDVLPEFIRVTVGILVSVVILGTLLQTSATLGLAGPFQPVLNFIASIAVFIIDNSLTLLVMAVLAALAMTRRNGF